MLDDVYCYFDALLPIHHNFTKKFRHNIEEIKQKELSKSQHCNCIDGQESLRF